VTIGRVNNVRRKGGPAARLRAGAVLSQRYDGATINDIMPRPLESEADAGGGVVVEQLGIAD
jgi:hypothetical protein